MLFETKDGNVQLLIPKSYPDNHITIFIKKPAFHSNDWQAISDFLDLDSTDDMLMVVPDGIAGF